MLTPNDLRRIEASLIVEFRCHDTFLNFAEMGCRYHRSFISAMFESDEYLGVEPSNHPAIIVAIALRLELLMSAYRFGRRLHWV
jgi:hypothetical protein